MAIIDTGAERSLGNPALLAASGLQSAAEDPETRKQVFAATSQAVFGNLVSTPSIRLGGVEIDNLQVVFGDVGAVRIGENYEASRHRKAGAGQFAQVRSLAAGLVDIAATELVKLLDEDRGHRWRIYPRPT